MERVNVIRNNRSNSVNEETRFLLEQNPMVVMRDKYTKTPLGISFSEEGLRGIANKNGVYLYCEGRVNSFNKAKEAKRSKNIIVERFIPLNEPNNPKLMSMEVHWATAAKRMLTSNSNANYNY
jgi:hypothetical protein